MTNNTEQWKDIPGYEGFYQISNLGRVKRTAAEKGTRIGRIVTPNKGGDGYQTVRLSRNGVKKTYSTHRIVAIVWIDNHNNYKQVNHKNGNKLDPRAENLEWCTAKQNMVHARDVLGVTFSTGTTIRGTDNGNSKLSDDDVVKIRELYETGRFTHRELAEIYGVNSSSITRAINKKSWNHI